MPSGKPCSWLCCLATRKALVLPSGQRQVLPGFHPWGYWLDLLALSSRTWCVGRQIDGHLDICVGPPLKGEWAAQSCRKSRCPGVLFRGEKRRTRSSLQDVWAQRLGSRSDTQMTAGQAICMEQAWGVQSMVHGPLQCVLLHFCL